VGVLPKVDPTVGAGVTTLQVKDYKEEGYKVFNKAFVTKE
jgi:hypothetical protein